MYCTAVPIVLKTNVLCMRLEFIQNIFEYLKKLHNFLLFLKKNSCKSCKNKCVKMTRKQLQTVYVFAKRIFPPLISFILRAWAKLNPNFNVLNYLVMNMRYPKPKFWMCNGHRTRFFVHIFAKILVYF